MIQQIFRKLETNSINMIRKDASFGMALKIVNSK